ncbi:hypothetical protein GCM10009802_10680 [Streptomyces synnematoformans]|uniref:Uncharacterized protein n=1 Tax=Streptomyces synnematoformans TaxID=415721 RepID=A0ABP5J764_9ACTN
MAKDGPRRPAHPEFTVSRVPPLELAHWLLKPATFVAGTWGDQVRAHAGALLPHDSEHVPARAESAARAVAGGCGRRRRRRRVVAGRWALPLRLPDRLLPAPLPSGVPLPERVTEQNQITRRRHSQGTRNVAPAASRSAAAILGP